jgi:hypothetical protein
VSDYSTIWGVPWLLLGFILVIGAGGLFFWLRRRGRIPLVPAPADGPKKDSGSVEEDKKSEPACPACRPGHESGHHCSPA